MEKNPGGQKFCQRGGGEISWNSILPPPKCVLPLKCPLPPKFRDLAPPLFELQCQKHVSCNKSVDILRQLVTTSRYQDAFSWLATACWRQVCCKLLADLLQVDCQNLLSTGLLHVVSTSCNKSENDKLQFQFNRFFTTDKAGKFVATCWQLLKSR